MTTTTEKPGSKAPSHPSWAFGLTVLVAVVALAAGREAAGQNQTDTAPDGFVPVPSVFSGGGSHFKIYKNYDAWFGSNVSEQVLQAAPFNLVVGVDYIVKPMADLALGIPADTDVVFIPAASDGNSLNQMTEQKAPAAQAALSTFVTGGGTLVIVLGDNSGDAYLVPGLLGTADDLTACNGLTIVDPTHPFIIGPDQIPGTGDDLNNDNIDAGQVGSLGVGTCNFCADLHGSLAGILPAGATVHIVDQANGNPGFAEYSLGNGKVLLATRPMEFHCDNPQILINWFFYALSTPTGPGACCLGGSCSDGTAEDCNTLGGVFQGRNTTCTALEACCFGDNTCQMLDPLCCDDEGGIPQGTGSTCGGMEACCDSVAGACYMADRTCCLGNGDTPQGPGTACSAPAACCFGDDTCQMLDPLCCGDRGGTSQGPGSTCGGMEACCDSVAGECYMADRTCCLANGDTPLGPGTACSVPDGCCFPDDTCQILDPLCCEDLGGEFCGNPATELIVNGDFETQDFSGWTLINSGSGGIVINDGTFDPPGPDGPLPPCDGSVCSITFQSGQGSHTLYQEVTLPSFAGIATLSWIDQIRNHAGIFSDPNQEFRVEIWDTNNVPLFEVFSTNPGDPPLNVCEARSFDVSNFIGQTVRVAFTQEDNLFFFNAHLDAVSLIVNVGAEVGEVEACCFPDDTCRVLNPVCCLDLGGTPQGPESTCGGIQACCDSASGACYMADRTCCLANGDTPQGPDTACSVPEACCFGDNTCRMLDILCCVNLGGTPQGSGFTCGGIEGCCDSETDACYMADRTCCLANGDTPQGPGSTCTAPEACCFGQSNTSCDLFGTDASGGSLLRIDPADGSATFVGFMGFSAPSLAVDPSTLIMYAGSGGGSPFLYTVNPADGSTIFVGDTGIGFAAIGGMDFSANGSLFAAVNIVGDGGTGSDHLAIIDPSDATTVIVGPFGTCSGFSCTIEGMEAIAFDNDGTLWGAKSARGAAGTTGLYTINPATGAATFVAPILDEAGSPPSGGIVSLKECTCDGKMYGGTARAISGSDGGRLVVIDLSTGMFAFVGAVSATGGSSLGGLALGFSCSPECQMLDPLCCANQGGTPEGPGSACGGIEACCDSVTGECYMDDRTCCLANGDTPQGPGTACTEPEACCLGDNTCQMLDPLCCVNQGGTPQGLGSTCGGIEACCDSVTGACYLADRTCCLANGDTPQGSGTACTVPEACCFGDNTCQMLDPLCCVNQGGTPHGPGSTCGGIEGCCDSVTEVCYMADRTCCLANGDIPNGPGSVCTAPAACCLSGTCELLDPLCCLLRAGVPQAPGTTCGECGSCCLADKDCLDDIVDGTCLAIGGSFNGLSSICVGDSDDDGIDDQCDNCIGVDDAIFGTFICDSGLVCETDADCRPGETCTKACLGRIPAVSEWGLVVLLLALLVLAKLYYGRREKRA